MVAEGVEGVVRLLPDEPIPGVDLWLLVHRDLARLAKVRAVLDFIYERAQAETERIAGRR